MNEKKIQSLKLKMYIYYRKLNGIKENPKDFFS